jgi:hypothetical protein
MATQSENSAESILRRSPPRKPSTSSASEVLTKSEIEALRQSKRRIDDYAQKALTGWAAKPVKWFDLADVLCTCAHYDNMRLPCQQPKPSFPRVSPSPCATA